MLSFNPSHIRQFMHIQ